MVKKSMNMVLRRVAIILPFYLFTFLPLHAQYEKMGGVYYAYPVESGDVAPDNLPQRVMSRFTYLIMGDMGLVGSLMIIGISG